MRRAGLRHKRPAAGCFDSALHVVAVLGEPGRKMRKRD
jgi:hypothetical protein